MDCRDRAGHRGAAQPGKGIGLAICASHGISLASPERLRLGRWFPGRDASAGCGTPALRYINSHEGAIG
jgi:hypothetical protein